MLHSSDNMQSTQNNFMNTQHKYILYFYNVLEFNDNDNLIMHFLKNVCENKHTLN